MSRWFRLYDDVINDPKLLKLPEALRWHWLALLCVASKNGGQLPPADDVALLLRIPEAKAAEYITKLVKAKLIDSVDGVFVPHNWEGRQFKSDTSGDRVAKYRDKRRSAGLPQMGDYSIFRAALIQRDGERCVYCDASGGLVVDHMTPIALGGTDHPDNLALACKPCNSGKSGRTPEMARKPVMVSSAMDALTRYRDMVKYVTVTLTAPEADTEADTEQSRADASAPMDADLRKREAGLKAGIGAHFAARGQPVPSNMERCAQWLVQGFAAGTVLKAVEAVLNRGKPVSTLEYFDGAIRDAHSKAAPAHPGPQIVSIQEFIIESTMEWFCWERHLRETTGRGSPVTDNRDEAGRIRRGWFRPTKVPPGYDEATGEKLAPAGEENAA